MFDIIYIDLYCATKRSGKYPILEYYMENIDHGKEY
jgi:hypothetical protein